MSSSSSNEESVRIRFARARGVRCAGARVTTAPSGGPRPGGATGPPASRPDAVELAWPAGSARPTPSAALAARAPGPPEPEPSGPPVGRRVARALEAIAAALEQRQRLERQAIEGLRRRVIDLGLRVAARVVHGEIDAGRHDAFRIIEEALAHTAAPSDAEVRLHPADEQSLRGDRRTAPLLESGIRLVADAAVPRGECSVRSGGGTVERRVSDALEALRRALETAADAEVDPHA